MPRLRRWNRHKTEELCSANPVRGGIFVVNQANTIKAPSGAAYAEHKKCDAPKEINCIDVPAGIPLSKFRMDDPRAKSAGSTFAKLERFIALAFVLALTMGVSGCCTFVEKAGDAKVKNCWRGLIAEQGSKFYRMKFPAVNIGNKATTVLHVRDLPPELAGIFTFEATLLTHSLEQGPWSDTRMTVIFKRLDGTEIAYERLFISGEYKGFSSSGAYPDRHDFFDLDNDSFSPHRSPKSKIKEMSYDIFVEVDQPSKRKTDRIMLSAFGYTYPSDERSVR